MQLQDLIDAKDKETAFTVEKQNKDGRWSPSETELKFLWNTDWIMSNFNRSSIIPSVRSSCEKITQRKRRDSNLIGDKKDDSPIGVGKGETDGASGGSSLYSWAENGRVYPESSRWII